MRLKTRLDKLEPKTQAMWEGAWREYDQRVQPGYVLTTTKPRVETLTRAETWEIDNLLGELIEENGMSHEALNTWFEDLAERDLSSNDAPDYSKWPYRLPVMPLDDHDSLLEKLETEAQGDSLKASAAAFLYFFVYDSKVISEIKNEHEA